MNSLGCFFQNGKGYRKCGALTDFAFALDITLVEVDDLLNISEPQAETLHIVHITSMHSVELVEDFLHVLLLDAKTRITDTKTETLLLIPSLDEEV